MERSCVVRKTYQSPSGSDPLAYGYRGEAVKHIRVVTQHSIEDFLNVCVQLITSVAYSRISQSARYKGVLSGTELILLSEVIASVINYQ